jgi:hypothetical protein
VIASASAGAGFALILAVIVGGVLWYGSRPRHPKPWDEGAIRARYTDAITEDVHCITLKSEPARTACEDADGEVLLTYELENTTDYDYRIGDQSSIEIMELDEKVLRPTLLRVDPGRGTSYWRLETPVFVPSHRKVAVDIKGPLKCPRCDADKLKSFVERESSELLLFDPGSHYEIELPKP